MLMYPDIEQVWRIRYRARVKNWILSVKYDLEEWAPRLQFELAPRNY